MSVDPALLLTWLKLYGPMGVTLGLLISGWLVPKAIYAREAARADAYEALARDALSMARGMQSPKG